MGHPLATLLIKIKCNLHRFMEINHAKLRWYFFKDILNLVAKGSTLTNIHRLVHAF